MVTRGNKLQIARQISEKIYGNASGNPCGNAFNLC